jgi:hypothetical protein
MLVLNKILELKIEPIPKNGVGFLVFRIVVGEIFNVFGPMQRRKNEWTNHAIAWYKHAI